MARGARAYGLAVLVAVTVIAAGCGGSSAPDVSGAPASDSATLFKASNLNKVLSQANGKLAGTSVTTLKIEPRDVKIVGQNKTVTVDSSGNALVVNTPNIPGQGTFSLSVVSPATVGSLVSAVESKGNLKESDIGYVTVAVDPTTNKPYYGVYPRSGVGHYQANINGGSLKSIGTSGTAASTGGAASTSGAASTGGATTTSGAASSAASKAKSLSDCLKNAGTDPAKIAACSGG
jgi:hypothetical protein